MCDNFMDMISTKNNFYVLGAYHAKSQFLLSKKIEENNSFLISNRYDFNKIKMIYPNYKILYISNNNFPNINYEKNIEIKLINSLENIGSLEEYNFYSYIEN